MAHFDGFVTLFPARLIPRSSGSAPQRDGNWYRSSGGASYPSRNPRARAHLTRTFHMDCASQTIANVWRLIP